MSMNTVGKVAVAGLGIILVASVICPALKGPYNRLMNNVNEQLNDEYVVDNYKVEYISLDKKLKTIVEKLSDFTVKQKIAEKKLALANRELAAVKDQIKLVGTSDMGKFAVCKAVYDTAKTNVDNLKVMVSTYSNAVVKLERSKGLLDVTMTKTKHNIATLESKKMLVGTIKEVNTTIENLNGMGEDLGMARSIEKLDESEIRESIKLEVLFDKDVAPAMDKAAADTWLKTL